MKHATNLINAIIIWLVGLVLPALGASYTTLSTGLDKTATPYNIGINLNGIWYNFATITAGGVFNLPISSGGTGQATASAAFNALSPMTTAGDLIYGGASGAGTRLPAGTSNQVLIGGAIPTWGSVNIATMVSGLGAGVATAAGIATNTNGGFSTVSVSATAPAAPSLFQPWLNTSASPSDIWNVSDGVAWINVAEINTTLHTISFPTLNLAATPSGGFGGVSGILPATSFPALTGDCTTTAGAVATTCLSTNGTTFASAYGAIVKSNLNTAVAGFGATNTNAVIVGTVNLTANLVVPDNVVMQFPKGSCINQTGAFTLQINSAIIAEPNQQIFCGFSAGQVTFGAGATVPNQTKASPYWWTDDANMGVVDATSAIQAATAAVGASNQGGTVEFPPGVYYTATCGLTIPYSSVAWETAPTAGSTYINCPSASATILTVSAPNYSAVRGGFIFNRTAATPAAGSVGIYANLAANAVFEGVQSLNSAITWEFDGASGSYCIRCIGSWLLSTSPGGSSLNPIWLFWVNSANPSNSMRFIDDFAFAISTGGVLPDTSAPIDGFHISGTGGINDTYVRHLETATVTNGVFVDGTGGSGFDLHFVDNIHDRFTATGYTFQNIPTAVGGAVTVSGSGWVNPTTTGAATIGAYIYNSRGVNITGGQQFFSGGNYANHTAIYCSSSWDLNITGNRIMNAKYGVDFNACNNSSIGSNSFFNLSTQAATAQIILRNTAGASGRNTVVGNILDGSAAASAATGIDATTGTYSTFTGNNCNPGAVTTCEAGTTSLANFNQSTDSIVPNYSFTPACVFTGGTDTSCTAANGNAYRIGNMVMVNMTVTVNYTVAPTSFTVSLPVTNIASQVQILKGRNTSQGYMLQCAIAGGAATCQNLKYDNTAPAVTASGDILEFNDVILAQ